MIPLGPAFPFLIPMELDTTILGLFLAPGTAAMIYALVSAYRTIKEGANQDEQDDYETAQRRASDAVRARNFAELERDYWRRFEGAVEYELTRKGGQDALARIYDQMGPPPKPPDDPPEEIKPPNHRRRPRRKAPSYEDDMPDALQKAMDEQESRR